MFRYPAFPFAALTTCFWLAASSVLFASSSVLTWSVLPPDPGGFGNWSNQDSAWFDEEGNPSSWQQGADALFSEAEGMASVRGSLDVGTLTALSQDTPIELDHLQFAQLTVRNIVGSPLFWFRQNIGAGANNYPEFNLLSQLGLVFRSDEPIVFTGTLFPLQGGSPFVSVRGPETVVDFAGTWIADTGSIISWLMPIESGTFRFTGEADMRFIKEDYYTLQLWVHGDGTGTLELAEDFQADRTNNATVPLGIGSIRISSTTLVTHHTRNLPLGYRPFGADRTQANGHLAFENGGGSRWIVRSHPQEYPGALWIYRDLEIHTEADLTHTGVTESAPDYTAFNGITLFGSSLVKSGPARLRLAGHQAYQPGSSMEIIEGGIDFITDPSGGIAFGGGRPMGELFLTVQEGSEASFHAPATIGDLAVAGTVSIGSSLRVAGDMGLFSLPEANWHFTLGSTSEHDPILVVETAAEFAGTIHLWRNAEFVPTPGARIPLLTANNLNLDTGWVLVDHTQTGVSLELDGNTLYAVTTRIAADTAGRILLEDFFEDLSQWSDLSTVPLWGNPQRHRSAFSTANNHVQLIREGPDTTAGWTNFSNANGLKTFTAIDHAFDEPVDRESSTLVVDARIRWHTVSNSSGEGGRFILSFTYDYPQGGLDLTPEGEPGSRIADFSQHWWAKPAYHLRMRNSDSRAGTSFLQYGGGPVFGGEFERTSGNFGYWLPGFISGAGGVAPGSGPDFPANSWVSTLDGLASATFRTYRYILYPDRQEVWRDDNDNGIFDPDELKAVMPLPLTSDAPFYAYIPSIEGLRLFWNGVGEGSAGDTGQVYVDWLRIIQNDTLLPEPRMRVPDIFVIYNGVNGKVLLDASETVLPNAGGALYQWYVDGSLTVSTHQQVTAVLLAVGERVIGLRVTDALGNQAYTEQMVIISPGNLLPIARPGDSQTITANDRLLARVSVDGSASSDPDGEIVRYRWTRANGTIVLSDGADAAISTVLPVGLHRLNLTVFDEEGASSSADVSIQVVSPNIGASEVIYRENFSRPNTSVEMGPWSVGWDLMSFNGQRVPSVQFDGNAHRSLSASSPAPYLPKVNADPLGIEFDAVNARGHMWMNQMPFLNATPAEWLLWTEEYSIDPQQYEIDRITFHGYDSSPERVKHALAVRINGNWYIHWDARIETQFATWRPYTLTFSTTGWYRFIPSPTFSIRNAAFTTLPNGVIDAFGLYMFKDYGWYVNQVDNFTIYARERQAPPALLAWQLESFPPEVLYENALEASVWGPNADPDGDGNINLLEFALGGDPLQPAPLLWFEYDQNDAVVLRFRRNPAAGHFNLLLQHSADLQNWQTDATAEWQQLPASSELQEWQIRPSIQIGERSFWRLIIQDFNP